MERAYTILDTKDLKETDDKFLLEGVASTPTPDRYRDVVEPMGAQFKAPMPLLWQHMSDKPVGQMTFAKPQKSGIPFRAEIPKIAEPGTLKDRIDEAIQSIKYKLVTAVSIGFKPLEYSYMDDGGIHFQTWEWLELSLVTIPANSEAVLSAVKSIDQKTLAALGRKVSDRDFLLPGVTGVKGYRRPIQLIPR